MKNKNKLLSGVLLTILVIFCAHTSNAQNLINNGNFTDGWNHWSRILEGGSSQAVANGSIGFITPIPAPTLGGNTFAFCGDQSGPSRNTFYQSFIVPPNSGLNIEFDMYVFNYAVFFYTPQSLEYSSFINQQIRVDLLIGSANIFSVASDDVISMLYRTNVGDPAVSGWNRESISLPADLMQDYYGSSVILRFTQVDNNGPFGMGFTNVLVEAESTGTSVPVSNWALFLGIGLILVFAVVRFRRMS